jgi:CRISPR system Cascade subunit CasD
MARFLALRFEGPLLSFGAEAIDNFGVVRDFPAASMLTGMIANSFGWRREWREQHQHLQDRLHFAARRDREGSRFTEFQTAKLDGNEERWTTRGSVEGRRGGADTYASPHLRYRDYDADASVTVVMRLMPEAEAPTLEEVAEAFRYPARPLFLGRKPFLPAQPIIGRDPFIEDEDLLSALKAAPLIDDPLAKSHRLRSTIRVAIPSPLRALPQAGWAEERVADERNWLTGLHGGERRLFVMNIDRSAFATAPKETAAP